MFKYLLFKGLEDISVIFNDVKAERPGRVRKLLEEANDKAAPVWNDHRIPFLERQARCKAILDPVIELNAASEFRFSAFPKSTVAELDKLFKQFYSEPAKVLLIGRTCKHAYEVQDRYATAVASLLGTVSRAYESRAAVCLRKVYGRNSIPLLSISSVSGLWELCKIPLYRAISSLVSLPPPRHARRSADPWLSSTSGFSLLQRFQKRIPLAATTSRLSTGSSGRSRRSETPYSKRHVPAKHPAGSNV